MSKNKWKKINYTAKEYKFQQDKQKKKDWILLFLPSQCLTQWNEWTEQLGWQMD